MRVLVTGGSGFIGRASVAALLAAGHDVRVLARDPARAAALFREIGGPEPGIVAGEPIDRATVERALDGRDALVHAAATYSYDRRDASRMLVETPALTLSVLGAALATGTPRVVDVSTAGVFSVDVGRVEESTPLTRAGEPAWGDPYLQAKVLAELAGRELELQGLPRVTIHPTMTVGPDDRGPGTSGSLLVRFLRGRAFPDGRLGWVDVREVAGAVAGALDARPGSNYILCRGAEPHTAVVARLDRLTGRRRRRQFLPGRVIRTVAAINVRLGAPMAGLPPPSGLEYMLRCPPVIDGSRAERDLGIIYRDFHETLSDAMRWWAANGVVEPKEAGRLAA